VKRLAVGLLVGLAVGLPAGAGGWWAYSKTGDESAERQLAGEVAEAPVVVTSGALRRDVSWALQAYESDKGLCLDIVVSGPEASAGGGCGFGVGKRRLVSFARQTVASLERTWIFGPAANAVQQVSVSLDGGRTLDLEPLSVSGFQVRFYVTSLPGSVGVRSISAKDGRGITLETLAIEPVPTPRPSSDPEAES
jgi:hypothetical protein